MTCRNDFPFKVGDKIRRPGYASGEYIEVLAIGRNRFFGRDNTDAECALRWANEEWLPFQEPLKEAWINLYDPDGSYSPKWHKTWDGARLMGGIGRVGIVHVWTDSCGVDHAEVIRKGHDCG